MYALFDTAIFYITWGIIFVLCYYVAHYQFRYCIPFSLLIMKVIYALSLLLLIRLYYLLRVEGMEMNWEQMRQDFVTLLNATTTSFDL